jgi:hypothetical protein
MRFWSLIALAVVGPLLVGPAASQQAAPKDGTREAEELARDAIGKLMRAMGLLVQSIPQYEMPEMQPNGDIIIRRKRPDSEQPATPRPHEDKT